MTAVSENPVPTLELGNVVSIRQMHDYLPYTMESGLPLGNKFTWRSDAHKSRDGATQNWGRWEESRMIPGLVCAGQRLASSFIAHRAFWKKDGLLDLPIIRREKVFCECLAWCFWDHHTTSCVHFKMKWLDGHYIHQRAFYGKEQKPCPNPPAKQKVIRSCW